MNDESPKAGEPRMTLSMPGPKAQQGAGNAQGGGQNVGPNKGPNPGGPGPKQGQPPNKGPNKPAPKGAGKPGADKKLGSAGGLRKTVSPARMKRRHWGLVLSFMGLVFAPFVVVAFYMLVIAEDQYSSVAGFTVRKEESGGASELLGGLAGLAGSGPTGSDSNILYEFILSRSLVQKVEDEIGLVDHYSAKRDADPIFALSPDASIEDLEQYWQRIVRVSYDQNSGLMELRVLSFEPAHAQAIARQIISESQEMINALNEQAREDAMRYATADLDEAVQRLKTAREALTAFRTRTQIVDPDADLQGRMGVMSSLQQQLAQALIEYDLLREQTSDSDPRILQAQRRIDAIRSRIAEERRSFASENAENSPDGEDYPSLIAEYEGLVVDREFAEESYRAALAALDVARAKASRQSRYLATYVEPTLAETSEYPQRGTIIGLAGLFLILGWSVLALIYYSIRDRA